MNIVLFGSSDTTLSVADFLHTNSYNVSAIVTVPQVFKISYKPDGVKNTRFVDMHSWGSERNIPVISYESVEQTIKDLAPLANSFAIVAGWYHMIPKKLRDLFPQGCAGFHASLLPQLRGGAPLNWSILLGLKETGVSFFELSDGVDNGLLYDQEKFSIELTDYVGDLVKKSERAILGMLARTLPKIDASELKKHRQEGKPSYCGQRIPEDSQIDWNQSSASILRLIKASSKPYAGAYSFLDDHKITIWEGEESDIEVCGSPGQIIIMDGKVYVACGVGVLVLKGVENKQQLMNANHKRLVINRGAL